MLKMLQLLLLSSATSLLSATFLPYDVDVVVIGAGWAGMAAADTLARANVSFVVLEVSNRTGGRSHALQFGDPAVWRGVVERGSNWVSGVAPPGVKKGGAGGVAKGMKHLPFENPVLTLAREADITLARVPGSADGNMSACRLPHTPEPQPYTTAPISLLGGAYNILSHTRRKCSWSQTQITHLLRSLFYFLFFNRQCGVHLQR